MKNFYSFDELTIPLEVKALFGGLYMVIVVYAVIKTLLAAPRNKRYVGASGFVALYFTVYAMFYCVNPDYFSYREWMNFPMFMDWNREQVYFFIIIFCRLIPFDYPFELFRLIVWGGGLLLVIFLARMYRSLLRPGLVILFLFVFYSGTYSYARGSLAMAVYFLGVGIFLWRKDHLSKVSGLALAISSYFFHHEMIIGIGALLCLMLPLEKKKSLPLVVAMLGVMMLGLLFINSNLGLMQSVFGADEIAEKMKTYNEREQGIFRASTAVSYLDFFYPSFLIMGFFYRCKRLPKAIAGLFRVTLVLLLATIAFFVVSGSRSTYTYRVLYISIIPMSILMAYCYNQGFFKKYQYVIMILIAIVANCMRLIQAV